MSFDDDQHDAEFAERVSPELNFVRAHPFTCDRGGITYPSRKETTMALTPKQNVRRLEAELDKNLDLQHVLKNREQELRADLRKADVPAAPPKGAGDMFMAEVQFAEGATVYTYLLIRSGTRWFTTGTKDDQKVFENWEALCAWLNSTHWHAALSSLRVHATRTYKTEHDVQVPF